MAIILSTRYPRIPAERNAITCDLDDGCARALSSGSRGVSRTASLSVTLPIVNEACDDPIQYSWHSKLDGWLRVSVC